MGLPLNLEIYLRNANLIPRMEGEIAIHFERSNGYIGSDKRLF